MPDLKVEKLPNGKYRLTLEVNSFQLTMMKAAIEDYAKSKKIDIQSYIAKIKAAM